MFILYDFTQSQLCPQHHCALASMPRSDFVFFLCFPLIFITLPKPNVRSRRERFMNPSSARNTVDLSSYICPHIHLNVSIPESRPKPETDIPTTGLGSVMCSVRSR